MTKENETVENKMDALKIMMAEENLGLENDADWKALVRHIDEHKYLINQDIPWTISWNDAVFSWFENVYTPLMNVTDWWEVRKAFPSYTRGQLMFALCSHWYYMNENGEVSPAEAANSFAAHYGKGVGSWVSRMKISA